MHLPILALLIPLTSFTITYSPAERGEGCLPTAKANFAAGGAAVSKVVGNSCDSLAKLYHRANGAELCAGVDGGNSSYSPSATLQLGTRHSTHTCQDSMKYVINKCPFGGRAPISDKHFEAQGVVY